MDDFNFLHKTLKGEHSGIDFSANTPIIIVEDDKALGRVIRTYLTKNSDHPIFLFESPEECIEALGSSEINDKSFCLVSDIAFEESSFDGLSFYDHLKNNNYQFLSILMTGFASIENAINATKKGIYHYLTKPFEMKELISILGNGFNDVLSIEFSLKRDENKPSLNSLSTLNFKLEEPKEEDFFAGMIGRSAKMKKVFARIQKVAASNSTVLITGPSGTGKELVASAIHALSPREQESLVSVNCGAIPSELLESELFGHEKGAFTGAVSARKGRFELANRGTIFLDEIGDMPLLLQVKILRVLQNRTIEKIGGSESSKIDVRIITATHRNLEEAVKNETFREDLFYRLNVIPIKIPALCERREDIPLLISHFLSKYTQANGQNTIELSDDVLDVLMTYSWPGNVRELENLIERLVILRNEGLVELTDLPVKFLEHRPDKVVFQDNLVELPKDGIDLKGILNEIENSLILQALNQTKGNKNQASKLLSLNRTTLIEKMKKKNLQNFLN